MKKLFKAILILGLGGLAHADIAVTPGVGKTVHTDTVNGLEYQAVKIIDGTTGGTSSATVTSIGLKVDLTTTSVSGTAATGAAASGNPVQEGVLASSNTVTYQTDTGSGVMSPVRGTRGGSPVTVLDCPREQLVKSSITITASTTETVILSSGAASIYNDLVEMLAINTSATASRIDFRSGGNGTTIDFAIYVPVGETRGFTAPHPWPQTLAAANWTAQSSASVTDIRLYGLYCKSK